MNPLHRPDTHPTFSRLPCRRVASTLVRVALVAAFVLPISGCSSGDLAVVKSATKVIQQDATSAAGQKLLSDVTGAALNVGLDIASGNDLGASVAGIQGAASALRDYEGLPAAPGSTTVARAAAAGSGVANVAAALVPNVEALVNNARQTATQQKVNVTSDDIIEAIARGFDAVADARPAPAAR